MKTKNLCTLKYHQNSGKIERKNDGAGVKIKVEDQGGEEKRLGNVLDEDLIKMRLGERKEIDWKNKLYLAPLTTV